MHLTRVFLLSAASAFGFTTPMIAASAENPALDAAVSSAVLDYTRRLDAATQKLADVRTAIANERAPLMDEIRSAEEQIATVQAELARLETEKAQAGERAQVQRNDLAAVNRNLGYVGNIVLESLKGLDGSRLPGESAALFDQANTLRQQIETGRHPEDAHAALDAADLLFTRLEEQLGGHTARGQALRDEDNAVLEGTFAFLGPDVLFQSQDGTVAGTVRPRKESDFAVTYSVPGWTREKAAAVFAGEPATFYADISGGKALRLQEMTGSFATMIHHGGVVGYVIIGLGVIALVITILKIADIRQLTIDPPAAVQAVTRALAKGARAEATAAIARLSPSTQELFAVGLNYADAPRSLLEEHLESFLLRQRLHHERRLPLLAVIATAGPLLGLLGTVTGMIKTFTLITVFGSGSATKLSSGISEALVATGLGLAVAIPTLVVHGFLAHRIHKGLSSLERYALEFLTAVEEARAAREPAIATLS